MAGVKEIPQGNLPVARTTLVDGLARIRWALNRLQREQRQTLDEKLHMRLQLVIEQAETAQADLGKALAELEAL